MKAKACVLLWMLIAILPSRGAITINQQPQNSATLVGSNAMFSVSASGSATLSYQWYKSGFPIPGAQGVTLSFQVLDETDAGQYKVQVKTSTESVFSNAAELTVLRRPVVTITSPEDGVSQSDSAPVIISATATTTATATITNVSFYRGTTVLGSDATAPYQIQPSFGIGDYTVYAIAWTDRGITGTSAPVTFHIQQQLPLITRQPFSQHTFNNRLVEFVVSATGPEAMTYRWTRNGVTIPGATATNLTVSATVALSGSVYRVIVSNSHGEVQSSPATLSVDGTIPNYQSLFKRSVPTRPGAEAYAGIASGNGALVAVGLKSYVTRSTDGLNWRDVSPAFVDKMNKIRFLNGAFWIAADQGVIFNSSDALTWTRVKTPATASLRDIAWDHGVYVAVGDAGAIVHSLDGITWVTASAGTPNFISVAAANGSFVAVDQDNDTRAFVSPNGVSWDPFSIEGTAAPCSQVLFFNGHFVLLRNNGVFTSNDGRVWQKRVTSGFQLATASPSRLMLFSSDSRIAHSEDGLTFTIDGASGPANPNGFEWFGGAYFAVGGDFAGAFIAGSVNGLTWSLLGPAWEATSYPRVQFAKDKFYITPAYRSLVSDGNSWGPRIQFGVNPSSYATCLAFTYGLGQTQVSLYDTTIFQSTNNQPFLPLFSGSGVPALWTFKYEDGYFLGLPGTSGSVYISKNGTTWSTFPAPAPCTLVSRAHGTIVASSGTRMFASEELGPWQENPSATTSTLQGIATDGEKFVAAGRDGAVVYSFDGKSWYLGRHFFSYELNNIAYGNGMFMAVGAGGFVAFSLDGINWEYNFLHTSQPLYGVAYGNDRWVVASQGLSLLQTGPQSGEPPPMSAISYENGKIMLDIVGFVGQAVRIDSRDVIESPSWNALEHLTLDAIPTRREIAPSVPQRFLRITAE